MRNRGLPPRATGRSECGGSQSPAWCQAQGQFGVRIETGRGESLEVHHGDAPGDGDSRRVVASIDERRSSGSRQRAVVDGQAWHRVPQAPDLRPLCDPVAARREPGSGDVAFRTRWAWGLPLIKVIRRRDGERLSSGFLAASSRAGGLAVLDTLRQEHAGFAGAQT